MRRSAPPPDGGLGFQDEPWWSRLAPPARPAWAEPDRPRRLVEQPVATDDPDPHARAGSGVWRRRARCAGQAEQSWLRFVDGRPVSAVTIPFRDWCCDQWEAAGGRGWALIGDHASWHVSPAVRGGSRTHHRPVKRAGHGIRLLACSLPRTSPWLTPIEPTWIHVDPRQARHRRADPAADGPGGGRARLRSLRLSACVPPCVSYA